MALTFKQLQMNWRNLRRYKGTEEKRCTYCDTLCSVGMKSWYHPKAGLMVIRVCDVCKEKMERGELK